MNRTLKKTLPFLLTSFVLVADQISKKLIVDNIPVHSRGYSFWNDFLRIVHEKNTGAAFSMGDSFPEFLRIITLVILPLGIMGVLAVYIVRAKTITLVQRWFLAGILGGGIGNIIDRIFRPDGVVDFINVKFYGLFGLERFPVFNVADSSIVVCAILIIITFILEGRSKNEQKT